MSTLQTLRRPASPLRCLSAWGLWQTLPRRSKIHCRMVPAVVEPTPLPWVHPPLPHRRLQLPLQALPPHCASAVSLQLALEERALAASTLEGVKLPVPREARVGP